MVPFPIKQVGNFLRHFWDFFIDNHTQYWFINCEPYYNLVFEPLDYVERQVIAKVKKKDGLSVKTQRSMIHPQYANRFIRQYLIDEKELSE